MHCFYDDVPDESAFERPGEEESDARVCWLTRGKGDDFTDVWFDAAVFSVKRPKPDNTTIQSLFTCFGQQIQIPNDDSDDSTSFEI